MLTKKQLSEHLQLGRGTLERLLERLKIVPVEGRKYSQDTLDELLLFKKEHPDIRAYLYQDTCMKKYGTTNVSKSAEVKEKKKKSYLEHYGVEHFAKTQEWRDKTIHTNREKYGVDFAGTSDIIKQKQRKTLAEGRLLFESTHPGLTALDVLPEIFNRKDLTTVWLLFEKLNIKPIKGYNNTLYVDREGYEKIENHFREISDTPGSSTGERSVLQYIREIYKGEVRHNVRDVIPPYELDIYIPEKHLAIEFNGLYFHRDKNPSYHINKTDRCQQAGIRLVQFWDSEWIEKQEICKSIIEYALGYCTHKYSARNLQVREIDSTEWEVFLNCNHIQGYVPASIRFGLYEGDKLIQGIGITKRSHKKGELELNRMATKLHTTVRGGFSKLLINACRSTGMVDIVSYVDRRLFEGRGYIQAAFKEESFIKPTYYYYRPTKYKGSLLHPRYHFMKKMIERDYKKGLLKYFHAEETEDLNMLKNGFTKVYDCGKIKVRYKGEEDVNIT